MSSVPTNFWQWMASLDGGERFALVVWSLFFVVFVISVVACTVYKIHKNRLEDALKRELLDRGMSADEIAAVVQAKPMSRTGVNPNYL
jgi:hypothetical protein